MNASAATALYVLAHALLQNARAPQAAVLLEALDAIRPGNERTLLALATAQIRQGRASEALRILDRLKRAGSACAPLHLLRAQSLSALHRHSEAHAALTDFLSRRAAAPHNEATAD